MKRALVVLDKESNNRLATVQIDVCCDITNKSNIYPLYHKQYTHIYFSFKRLQFPVTKSKSCGLARILASPGKSCIIMCFLVSLIIRKTVVQLGHICF